MNELYIKIEWSECNEGYMVDIYASAEDINNEEGSLDGGLCENEDILEAAGFAVSILKDHLRRGNALKRGLG